MQDNSKLVQQNTTQLFILNSHIVKKCSTLNEIIWTNTCSIHQMTFAHCHHSLSNIKQSIDFASLNSLTLLLAADYVGQLQWECHACVMSQKQSHAVLYCTYQSQTRCWWHSPDLHLETSALTQPSAQLHVHPLDTRWHFCHFSISPECNLTILKHWQVHCIQRKSPASLKLSQQFVTNIWPLFC